MKKFRGVAGIIAMLCAIALTLPLIFACGDKTLQSSNDTTTQPNDGNNADNGANDNEPTEDPRLSASDDLPDIDFNGATFTIIYPTWSM